MAKTLLKVAAGINLVIGGLILLVSLLIINVDFIAGIGMAGIVTSAVRLIIGAVFLNSSKKDDSEFLESRMYVLVASIISILTGHFVTFILGIIAYSDMNGKVPHEEKIKRARA